MNPEETSENEAELAGKPVELNPKEWVDKRLAEEQKTRNPQSAETIAEFLATQDGATDKLVELLNRIKNFSPEDKRRLIDCSCESTNKWAGYMRGRWPGDKGEQISPADYYKLLTEEKVKLAGKNQKSGPLRVQSTPLRKAA